MTRYLFAVGLLSLGLAARADKIGKPTDRLVPNAKWEGNIILGDDEFPATFVVKERARDRINGEIRMTAGQKVAELYFFGRVFDADRFALLTVKKSGDVGEPGLYIGKVSATTIHGVWEAPTHGMTGSFEAFGR